MLLSLKTSGKDLTDPEKIEHLQYLIITLLPFLKEIHQEQIHEIEIESSIQGMHLNLKNKTLNPMIYIDNSFYHRGISIFS